MSETLNRYLNVDEHRRIGTELKESKRFELYIPAARRKNFAEFLKRVDYEGKRACNVIMDLVDEYLGVGKQ